MLTEAPKPIPYFGHIRISDYYQDISSPAEAIDFTGLYGESVPPHDWIRATLIPTRTDDLKSFAKDLFLPTFVNQAMKVQELSRWIFAAFFSLIIDLLTLLPRLCAAPIKVFYDHYSEQPPHPLNTLLNGHASQFEVVIYHEKNKIEGNQATKTAQKIHWWVTTKANPEDQEQRSLSVNCFVQYTQDAEGAWTADSEPEDIHVNLYARQTLIAQLLNFENTCL
jgi:hypothetical protein